MATQHGIAVLLLAAVAGAAVFLDWRLTDEMATSRAGLARSEEGQISQGERLQQIEKRLDAGALQSDVAALLTGLQEVQSAVTVVMQVLPEHARNRQEGHARLEDQLRGLQQSDQGLVEQLTRLDAELVRMAADLSHLRANPRAGEPAGPREYTPMPDPRPLPPEPDDATRPELDLPPDLAHQIQRLKDPEAGVRFEAVHKLILSGNEKVRETLLKVAKDNDPFVRRLTVEGLASFRHPDTVDVLIEALADRESIVRMHAYVSLRSLSQQKLAYDPDGSEEERLAGQRRWQDWWKGARARF